MNEIRKVEVTAGYMKEVLEIMNKQLDVLRLMANPMLIVQDTDSQQATASEDK